jgi:hypothetical protein
MRSVLLLAVLCILAVLLAACASEAVQTIPTDTNIPPAATEMPTTTVEPSPTATTIPSSTPTEVPPTPTVTPPPADTATPMPTPTSHPDSILLFKPSFNPKGVQYTINQDAVLLYKDMAVAAGVVAVLDLLAVWADKNLPTQGRGAAGLNRSHDLQMIGRDAPGVLLAVDRTVVAEDIRQFYRHKLLTIWLMASTAGPSAWGVR